MQPEALIFVPPPSGHGVCGFFGLQQQQHLTTAKGGDDVHMFCAFLAPGPLPCPRPPCPDSTLLLECPRGQTVLRQRRRPCRPACGVLFMRQITWPPVPTNQSPAPTHLPFTPHTALLPVSHHHKSPQAKSPEASPSSRPARTALAPSASLRRLCQRL